MIRFVSLTGQEMEMMFFSRTDAGLKAEIDWWSSFISFALPSSPRDTRQKDQGQKDLALKKRD